MLAHIFSYCDVSTLAVLSLVSFGSWELASPILYEHVEIVDLDGLASLFFLVSANSHNLIHGQTGHDADYCPRFSRSPGEPCSDRSPSQHRVSAFAHPFAVRRDQALAPDGGTVL